MTDTYDFKISVGLFPNGNAQLVAQVGGMAGACVIGTISALEFDAEALANRIAELWNAAPASAPSTDGEIKATQVTMGRGMVDVAPIHHEGRAGVLFRPRAEHIPVGEPGELQDTKYWPIAGDVVIWIDNEAGAEVARDAFAEFCALAATVKDACPVCGCEEVDHRDLWTCRCPASGLAPASAKGTQMDIDAITRRFLQWKLPEDFRPDGGVTFTRDFGAGEFSGQHKPVGTNLLTFDQAKAMFEHVLAGVEPARAQPCQCGERADESNMTELSQEIDRLQTKLNALAATAPRSGES